MQYNKNKAIAASQDLNALNAHF